MKVSVSVSGGNVKLPMVMFRENLESSFAKIAELGYDGVELMLHSPNSAEAESVKEMLDRYGLSVGMLVAVPYLVEQDVILGHPDRAVRQKFLEKAHEHLALAAELGAVVPIGFTHGYIRPGSSRAELESWFLDALPGYLKLAEEFGVTLVLENINRYEVNYINRVEEALEIIRKFSSPNLKLLFDVFHASIEEQSIVNAVRTAGNSIGHVHFVDSNRWAPGYGHLDLKEIYRQLKAVNYDSYIGIEALPMPDPESGARSGLEFVRLLQSTFG